MKHTKEFNQKLYQDNKELYKERARLQRLTNPQYFREMDRKWRKANPARANEIARNSITKRQYGITFEQYKILKEQQNGLCYICGSVPGKKGLVLDHDHQTKRNRKFLCSGCNIVIGHCKENVIVLQKIIDYLKEHANG